MFYIYSDKEDIQTFTAFNDSKDSVDSRQRKGYLLSRPLLKGGVLYLILSRSFGRV